MKLIFDTLKKGWEVELNKVMKLQLVPSVVHFHGLDTEQITHGKETRLCQYSVWDYIAPGENLRDHLKRVGTIGTSFLLRRARENPSCFCMLVMRMVSNVHGDLHSGNILIGETDPATLDDMLKPRAAIYVSDFGYGTTGGRITLKDDYQQLARIVNEMIRRVDYVAATATEKQMLQALKQEFGETFKGTSGDRKAATDRPFERAS